MSKKTYSGLGFSLNPVTKGEVRTDGQGEYFD